MGDAISLVCLPENVGTVRYPGMPLRVPAYDHPAGFGRATEGVNKSCSGLPAVVGKRLRASEIHGLSWPLAIVLTQLAW